MNRLHIKDTFNKSPVKWSSSAPHSSAVDATPRMHSMLCVSVGKSCDEGSADEAAARDHLHMAPTRGARSASSILSSLPSPPLLLTRAVRGDIHLTDGLCDLPFWAWWEKERCQHKYPSWFHGGHRAAMAAMNLHPLSQAEKQSPSAWLKTMPSPADPTPPPQANKTVSLLLLLDLFARFYFRAGRQTGRLAD